MKPKVLVITVTYNAMKWIGKVFESLKASSVPSEMIIIDNGSTDGTQAYIKERHPEVIFIQSPSNLGFGKANNIGLKYAVEKEYDYAYLLNQDAWIDQDCLKHLIDAHTAHREFGILSPIQIQANRKRMDNNFLHSVAAKTLNNSFLNDLYFGKLSDIYEVQDVMAAHWLISRECIKKTGGFSPAFSHYGEDNNYIDRAIWHGFKIGIVPQGIGVHDRENRKDAFACPLKRLNLATLIEINDITKDSVWWRCFKKYFLFAYKHKTLKHYKFLLQMLLNSRKFNGYRKASKQVGAFLNTELK